MGSLSPLWKQPGFTGWLYRKIVMFYTRCDTLTSPHGVIFHLHRRLNPRKVIVFYEHPSGWVAPVPIEVLEEAIADGTHHGIMNILRREDVLLV